MNQKLEANVVATPHHNLIIRFATQADLPQIAHIAQITWNATYSDTIAAENRRDFLERAYKPENLASAIDAPGHWFYVVELERELIGFGHFLRRYHRTQARAELVRLYVLPGHQSLGVGTLILRTGFAALAQAGVEQCFVSVQETNTQARKFYERHGFIYHRKHGQFLGTQIVVLVQYIRPISESGIIATP
ncbi:MAG: GNAT family N-acetyltransferase [Anaerolineae bacterium]|nr:GNAT family N-acetyltransferase [Anaerolineae bacterium]